MWENRTEGNGADATVRGVEFLEVSLSLLLGYLSSSCCFFFAHDYLTNRRQQHPPNNPQCLSGLYMPLKNAQNSMSYNHRNDLWAVTIRPLLEQAAHHRHSCGQPGAALYPTLGIQMNTSLHFYVFKETKTLTLWARDLDNKGGTKSTEVSEFSRKRGRRRKESNDSYAIT